MRSVLCEAYGLPSGLVVRGVDDLVPVPGAVVAAVEAAGVNFSDVLLIADSYQMPVPVPFTPGSEYAGRVAAVGDGVTDWRIGDPVMGAMLAGACADQVMVPSADPSSILDGLDMVTAAAFHVTYATAFHSLVTSLVGEGMRPSVTNVFSLEKAPDALELVANRRAAGKVVIPMRRTA